MHSILNSPKIYLLSQYMIGAMSARRLTLENYAGIQPGLRILDIGCGPGYIVEYLPKCEYVGFDLDERYIAYAKDHYGDRHQFHCRTFDAEQVENFEKFDLVLMNGLLHHVDDDLAHELIKLSRNALKEDGKLLSLDGCYKQGQSSLARYLLDKDRGQYVRQEEGYRVLAQSVFSKFYDIGKGIIE